MQPAIYFLPFRGKTAEKGGEMTNPTLAQPNPPRAPKLPDRVRETMRASRYSPRTEAVYVDWIKRYIRFHGIWHPQDMGADKVKAFLSLWQHK